MNYKTIKTAGNVLRCFQAHRLGALLSPENYVRVTYSHQVMKENEAGFESIVRYLVQTYNMISSDRFFEMLDNKEPVIGRHVLMTFDDGLLSSYRAIKNILSKFDVKAAVFVPTQILELKTAQDMKQFAWRQLNFKQDDPPSSLKEEEYVTMGAKELLDLKRDGHSIFPHTHSHRRLIDITDEKTAMEELVKPRKILQELLQCEMEAFAFPVGTERVASEFCFPFIQREYRFCFTGLAGKNTPDTDPYLIHRDCTNADYDLSHVRNMQDGVFDAYYLLKSSRLRRVLEGAGVHGT